MIVQDLIVGRGALAQEGDRIKVHYVGKYLDGTQFDSSRDRRVPLEFALGTGTVLEGLDRGVRGMRVGGMRKLTIRAEKTVVYDVELLKVG